MLTDWEICVIAEMAEALELENCNNENNKIMGCFNSYGFYSHLPIRGGDKIVLIPCYSGGDFPETLTTSTITGCLRPLCFPLFGEYDDYGFIENVREDFNTRALIKVFGVKDLDELLGLISKFSRRSIPCQYNYRSLKNNTTNEMTEDAKLLVELMERLSSIHPFREFTKQYSRLTYVIEREDVYNKLSELEKSFVHELEDSWNKIIELLDKYSIEKNILTIWDNSYSFSKITMNDEDNIVFLKSTYDIEKLIGDCGFNTFIFQECNLLNNNDPGVKKYFFEFLGFLSYIYHNGGYLTESAYGYQDWEVEKTLKYKEFEVELLKNIIEDGKKFFK